MSENQQPLTEEKQTVAPTEDASAEIEPTVRPIDGDAALTETPKADEEIADETDTAEEEPDIDPADVRIFGMPRICFHGAALGIAAGYILCGLVGILAENTAGTAIGSLAAKSPSATVWAVACAVIGYLISRRFHKKRLAAKEAELAAAAADTPE